MEPPPLNRHLEFLDPSHEPTGIGENVVVTKHEEGSVARSVGAYRFASVVHSAINLVADLTITFLRPEAPGKMVTKGGDLDNRIKTLLDALKVPSEPQSLPEGSSPTTGKVLWISAVVLVLLVGIYIVASNVGNATPMLLNPGEPLLDEGVAMVMVCGEQPTRETVNMTAEAVVRPEWAGERWTYRHRRGDCVVYYHHPRNGD